MQRTKYLLDQRCTAQRSQRCMAPKFHSTTDAFLNTQVSLAPTPVSPVADMVADIEVHMVADMKVDSNINIINFFHKHHNIINDYHKHHKRLSSSKFEMYTNTITVCNFLPFEIQIIWVGESIINGINKRVVAWIGLIGLIWAGRSDALWWLFGGDLKIGFVWDEKTSPPIMA